MLTKFIVGRVHPHTRSSLEELPGILNTISNTEIAGEPLLDFDSNCQLQKPWRLTYHNNFIGLTGGI